MINGKIKNGTLRISGTARNEGYEAFLSASN
jgi:hypothetical protein